jgi:hypothetical protein
LYLHQYCYLQISDELYKKERKKDKLIDFRFSFYVAVVLSSFSYDLPPFFATLVFVFLLADASPFLLDFFLVAIISMIYARTIINDLLVSIGRRASY